MQHDKTRRLAASCGGGLMQVVPLLAALLLVGVEAQPPITYSVCPSGCTFASVNAAIDAINDIGSATVTHTVNVGTGTYLESSTQVNVPITLSVATAGATITFNAVYTSWLQLVAPLTITGGPLTILGTGLTAYSALTVSAPLSITLTATGLTGVAFLGSSTRGFIVNSPLSVVAGTNIGSMTGITLDGEVHWYQYANTLIDCTLADTCNGIYIVPGASQAVWLHQSGSTTVRLGLGTGVRLYNTNWMQYGELNVEAAGYGVLADTDTTWHSTARVDVTARLGAYVATQWLQEAEAYFTGASGATAGVQVSGQWLQYSPVTIAMGSNSTGVAMLAGSWEASSSALITVSAPDGIGISNPSNYAISVTNSTSAVDRVMVMCEVAGATAINYPAKLQCCTGCFGPYNLTWSADDSMSLCGCEGAASPCRPPLTSPSPSLSPSTSPTPSLSSSPSPTPSPSPSISRSPTPSPSPSPTPSLSSSPSRSASPSPSASPSRSSSPSPAYFRSDLTGVPGAPVLQFNYSAPQMLILPTDKEGTVQPSAAVELALESVAEVVGINDSTPLANLTCAEGSGAWAKTNASDVVQGALQSFVYSCRLLLAIPSSSPSAPPSASASALAEEVELELQFDLFDNTTVVSVSDGLVNLTLAPTLAKLTVRVRGAWPWSAAESRLEVRLAVRPNFSRAHLVSSTTTEPSRSTNASTATTTWWRLEDQAVEADEEKGLRRETRVRLVDVVELDGEGRAGVQWVSANLVGSSSSSSSSSSSLVLSFGHFNESLVYDPDIGLLLGRDGDGGGGGSNVGLIVGVSVAVPTAIAVVALIVVVAVVVERHRRHLLMKRHYEHSKLQVGFSYGEL